MREASYFRAASWTFDNFGTSLFQLVLLFLSPPGAGPGQEREGKNEHEPKKSRRTTLRPIQRSRRHRPRRAAGHGLPTSLLQIQTLGKGRKLELLPLEIIPLPPPLELLRLTGSKIWATLGKGLTPPLPWGYPGAFLFLF